MVACVVEDGSIASRRDAILRSARDVLQADGYAGFSVRSVASHAGIAAGNLTYHFPTKADLVIALIEGLANEYAARYEQMMAALPEAFDLRLAGLVRFLMNDGASEGTYRLFRELWGLALHDPSVANALDDFYDSVIHAAIAALGRTRGPRPPPRLLRELVHLIAILSEGTSVLYATRPTRQVALNRVVALACELLLRPEPVEPSPPARGRSDKRTSTPRARRAG